LVRASQLRALLALCEGFERPKRSSCGQPRRWSRGAACRSTPVAGRALGGEVQRCRFRPDLDSGQPTVEGKVEEMEILCE
jgi:hypothetical protein